MHRKLMHAAAIGGADFSAHEFVIDGDPLLHQLGTLRADIGELRGNFGRKILVDLQDLHLDLTHPNLGLRG